MSSLPLGRLKMLDLAQLPGPFCSTLLADLGMDVLVITAPRDPVRARYSVPGAPQAQHDAGSEDGRRTRRLPAAGRRRGRAARGLPSRRHAASRASTGSDLHARNPRLVYCAISGYGQDGPYRDKVGHDVNYLGYAGVLEYSGAPDGPPMIPPVQVADVGAGSLMAAVGILSAIDRARRRPAGASWSTSRCSTAPPPGTSATRSSTGPAACCRSGARSSSPGTGRATPSTRRGTRASSPSAPTSRTSGPRSAATSVARTSFRSSSARRAARRCSRFFRAAFREKTLDEWIAELGRSEICFGPVLNIEEAYDDPQLRHRGMVVDVDTPSRPPRYIGSPVKLSEMAPAPPRRCRVLGEHTDAVLRDLGYAAGRHRALREQGVIG